jgi:hypothetical protein
MRQAPAHLRANRISVKRSPIEPQRQQAIARLGGAWFLAKKSEK